MRARPHIEPVIGDFELPDWEAEERTHRASTEDYAQDAGYSDEAEEDAPYEAEDYEGEAYEAEALACADPDELDEDELDEALALVEAVNEEDDEEPAPWEEPVPVVAVRGSAAVDTKALLAARVVAMPSTGEARAEPAPVPELASPYAAQPAAAPHPLGESKSMQRLGERLRDLVWYDRQLLVAALCLLAIGLIMVTSSSLAIAEKQTGNSFYYALRHGFYLAVAIAGAIIVLQIPMNFWMRSGTRLLLAGIALLMLILVPGVGHEVNGSVRWLALGGFTLQVSELVKLFLIIFMAGYLVRKSDEVRTQLWGFLKPLGLLGVLGVLLLAEPDFGATVVVFATAFAMMFLAGARLWQYLAIGGVGLAGLWFIAIASPYRMKRLTTFLDPWSDPYGSGYQLTQSLIAFGRGGFLGQGLGNSVQKLAYLPEAHTDFVFAVLAEELGLVGVVAVLAVFGWLAFRIFQVGRRALDAAQPFSAYIAFGIAVWLSLQAVINIGVASGILPTKGLTLPLVSYGGSSLIVTLAAVAIVLRIDFERRLREHFGLGRKTAC